MPAASVCYPASVSYTHLDVYKRQGLVHARVYYELNPETGKSEFVGRERMMQLLDGYPTLHAIASE